MHGCRLPAPFGRVGRRPRPRGEEQQQEEKEKEKENGFFPLPCVFRLVAAKEDKKRRRHREDPGGLGLTGIAAVAVRYAQWFGFGRSWYCTGSVYIMYVQYYSCPDTTANGEKLRKQSFDYCISLGVYTV
jgi:hypothetical protein